MHHEVNTQLGGISVSLIQAGVKAPMRVAASLFLYLLAASAIWRRLQTLKDKGTLQDRLVQTLPHPCPPATFCTYWLASFFS